MPSSGPEGLCEHFAQRAKHVELYKGDAEQDLIASHCLALLHMVLTVSLLAIS